MYSTGIRMTDKFHFRKFTSHLQVSFLLAIPSFTRWDSRHRKKRNKHDNLMNGYNKTIVWQWQKKNRLEIEERRAEDEWKFLKATELATFSIHNVNIFTEQIEFYLRQMLILHTVAGSSKVTLSENIAIYVLPVLPHVIISFPLFGAKIPVKYSEIFLKWNHFNRKG